MGLFSKRKIELPSGEIICDKASRFTDYKDGSVCYKGGFFAKEQCFKSIHIVRDETEGFFENFDCSSKKDGDKV